ncbi:MAG: glucosyl-3-phosphoglycerate synthase [Chloroflexi bacterium]|nr:glucosyl-3-phosphoglycerate synthase [Chloroflexota bacterium]
MVTLGDEKGLRILIPATHPEQAEDLFAVASRVFRRRLGRVVVLGVVEVPDGSNLSLGALQARAQRQFLGTVAPLGEKEGIEVKTVVRVAREAWRGIQEVVAEEGIHLLLLEWMGQRKQEEGLFGTTIRRLAASPPCHLAVVKLRDISDCRSILVPVRGGPHAELALELALALSESLPAKVTVMNVTTQIEEKGPDDLIPRTQRREHVQLLRVPSPSVEEAILEEAKRHQLVVMGASAALDGHDTLFGVIPEAIMSQTQAAVIITKTREPVYSSPSLAQVEPVAAQVDKWFAENTFHGREFRDYDELLYLKRKQGLTISLGLPALNEEDTIGTVLRVVKGELMEHCPLLDEIAVLDGGSTDRTMPIARGWGVPVYYHKEVLARYSRRPGKGDALWKSLYFLKGDILLWIDTDIMNIHPRFICGVLGPLLREEHIQYVTSFYGRAMQPSDYYQGESDPVAHLVARPLINLFFPQLSGLVEPPSREHGGRRRALEQVPFFSGFGVEMGLLLDMWARFGLKAIGQSDLEDRVQRDLPLIVHWRRSFGVIQAIMKRVEQQRRVSLLEGTDLSMKLLRYEQDRLYLELQEVEETELPPMVTVPEYSPRR